MDQPSHKLNTRKKLESLLRQLSLNGQINDSMSMPALLEEAATYQALGVLAPLDTLEDYKSAGLSPEEVAVKLCIPLNYARMAMDDSWPDTLERIMNLLD